MNTLVWSDASCGYDIRTVDAVGILDELLIELPVVPVKALTKDPIPTSKPGQHVCGELVHPPR